MAKEPETVTISREVFERAIGAAYAAFSLSQWNYMILVRRGYLTAEEATKGLHDLAEIARRAEGLAKLAAPALDRAINQLQQSLQDAAMPRSGDRPN